MGELGLLVCYTGGSRVAFDFRLNDYFALTSQANLHGGESVRDARTAAVGTCYLVRVATYMQSMRRECFKMSIHSFQHQETVLWPKRGLVEKNSQIEFKDW